MTYTLSTPVTFKRAAGRSVKELIDGDIEYVKWLNRKGLIQLDKDAFDYLVECNGQKAAGYKTHNFKPQILKYRRK